MKSFVIAIVDDQGHETGFGRFLRLLNKNQYLNSNDFSLNEKKNYHDSLGKNAVPNSISFQIYTHNYGNSGFKKSFCEAIEDFSKRTDEFDIFIFDLNFIEQGDNSFYPLNSKNTCALGRKFKLGLPLDKVNESNKSTYIAGLEFYQLLQPSSKPKIIYSAAQETAVLRSSVRLFSSRLYDTTIVDVIAPEQVYNHSNDPFAKSNTDVVQAFSAIDSYLQSRQVAIINRQSYHNIQDLSAIVNNWQKGDVAQADEPYIPDSGDKDAIKEDCWSLRTLFPKQVNRIELGIDVEENKEAILECLNNLSFPAIYDWLVHLHGNIKSKEYKSISSLPIVKNRFAALPSFSFSKSDKIPYKDFAEIINYDSYNFETVRCELYKQVHFESILPENQFITEQTKEGLLIPNDVFKLSKTNKQNSPAIRQMAEYGLYLGDLKLFYDIIESNAKYNFSESHKTTNTNLPKPKLALHYSENFLTVTISYESDNAFYNQAVENLKPVHEKIASLQKDKSSWSYIDQLGPSQIYKVLAYRYKSRLEVRIGKHSFFADRNEVTVISENHTNNATYFQFKLNKIQSK